MSDRSLNEDTMLTGEDVDRFSNENKPEFEELLHEQTDLYPGLEEVTTDLTKGNMRTEAKRIIRDRNDEEDLLSDDAKAASIQDLVENNPEAVIIPRRGGFLQIRHPEVRGEFFELSVFEDLSSETVSQEDIDNRREEVMLDGTDRISQLDIQTTPLAEAPEWVYAELYDLMHSGVIELFMSPEKAQESMNEVVRQDKQLLDKSGGFVGKEHYLSEDEGMGSDEVLTRPILDGEQTEHEAANNVLNRVVNGRKPLPDADVVTAEARSATAEEVRHVEMRIRKCLEDPNQWVKEQVDAESFDVRHFLGHLVKLELNGQTPSRKVNNPNEDGGMRPDVVRMMREVADENGLEVIGETVRRKSDVPDDMDEEVGNDLSTELMNPDVVEDGGASDEPEIESLR